MRNSQEQNSALLDDIDTLVAIAPIAVEGTLDPHSTTLQEFAVAYLPDSQQVVLYINAHLKKHAVILGSFRRRHPEEELVIRGGGGVVYEPATKKLTIYSDSEYLGTVDTETMHRFLVKLQEAFGAEVVDLQEPPRRRKAQAA